MTQLDEGAIRAALDGATVASLARLDVLAEIDSTNSWLMEQSGPPPGAVSVALTDNQTAGRGRHGRNWTSPPGSGLCLSMAYTFPRSPENLSALTLAIGLAAVEALADLGIDGVQLKWPNDLVARDAKLGGILTETRARTGREMTVVTGIGINVDFGGALGLGDAPPGALTPIDLASVAARRPTGNRLAAQIVAALRGAFVAFEADGFAGCKERWMPRDWLAGRRITVASAGADAVSGTGAGIDSDGALLVDTGTGVRRVTAGTIAVVGCDRESA